MSLDIKNVTLESVADIIKKAQNQAEASPGYVRFPQHANLVEYRIQWYSDRPTPRWRFVDEQGNLEAVGSPAEGMLYTRARNIVKGMRHDFPTAQFRIVAIVEVNS